MSLDPFASRAGVGEWGGGQHQRMGGWGTVLISICLFVGICFGIVRNASTHQSDLARVPKAGFGLCWKRAERNGFFYPIYLSPRIPCYPVSAVARPSCSKLFKALLLKLSPHHKHLTSGCQILPLTDASTRHLYSVGLAEVQMRLFTGME